VQWEDVPAQRRTLILVLQIASRVSRSVCDPTTIIGPENSPLIGTWLFAPRSENPFAPAGLTC
jgi:hypothetical protein